MTARTRLRSLQWRLLSISFTTIAIACLVAGAGLSALFSRHVERSTYSELGNHTRTLLGSLEITPDDVVRLSGSPSDPLFSTPNSGLYWQISEHGRAVLRSRSLWDFELNAPDDELASTLSHHHRLSGPNGSSLMAVERPLRLGDAGKERAFRVVVAVDRRVLAAALDAFNRDLLLALGGLALVLFLASLVQARLGLLPLSRLQAHLSAVRNGSKARLDSDDAPREVLPLILEVNGLLDQRDAAILKARARAADLAHGLKTPLTALEGDVARLRALGLDQLANDIGGVSGLMQRHIQAELTRARIAGARDLGASQVLVRPAVEAIIAVVARLPQGQALRFDIDIGSEDRLRMDAGDFNEVIGNLLENAVRHARSEIKVSLLFRGDLATMEVLDDGQGMSPEDVVRMQRRGQSQDSLGSGAGLGLAIVSEILEAYGSALTIRNREAGGLSASFTISA